MPSFEDDDQTYIECPECYGKGVVFDGDGEEDNCPNGCKFLYVVPSPTQPNAD